MIRSEKCIYYFFIGNQWCLTIRQLSGLDACVHQLTIFLNQAKRYKMIHQIIAWQILWIHNLQNRTLINLLQVLPTTGITYNKYYLQQILPTTDITYYRYYLLLQVSFTLDYVWHWVTQKHVTVSATYLQIF